MKQKSTLVQGATAPPPLGFSLLELLVAVLVVALGTLGVAGLQLATAQSNRAALQQGLAMTFVGDLVERIRANRTADYSVALGAPPSGFVDCMGADCTPAQLASFDLAVWKCGFGRWRQHATCEALPVPVRPETVLVDGDGAVATNGESALISVVGPMLGGSPIEIQVARRWL